MFLLSQGSDPQTRDPFVQVGAIPLPTATGGGSDVVMTEKEEKEEEEEEEEEE